MCSVHGILLFCNYMYTLMNRSKSASRQWVVAAMAAAWQHWVSVFRAGLLAVKSDSLSFPLLLFSQSCGSKLKKLNHHKLWMQRQITEQVHPAFTAWCLNAHTLNVLYLMEDKNYFIKLLVGPKNDISSYLFVFPSFYFSIPSCDCGSESKCSDSPSFGPVSWYLPWT